MAMITGLWLLTKQIKALIDMKKIAFFLFGIFSVTLIVNCDKFEVEPVDKFNIEKAAPSFFSSKISGNIIEMTRDNGVDFGLCFSVNQNPTVDNNKVQLEVSTTGNFEGHISELNDGTIYYVRAYLNNSGKITYSNEISFQTLHNYTGESGTLNDIDGNTYSTIGIGSQIWMSENLKTSKFSDGTDIPNITNQTEWLGLTSGAWRYYDDNEANNSIHGKLYNYYAVTNTKNVCPSGWKVPSDEDWKTLEMFLGMTQIQADSVGVYRGTNQADLLRLNDDWPDIDLPNANNQYGFKSLPSGRTRIYSTEPYFSELNTNSYFWCSTPYLDYGYYRVFSNLSSKIARSSYHKNAGFSVRCIKGEVVANYVAANIIDVVYTITNTSAICTTYVNKQGDVSIIERGICWSTNNYPTINDNKLSGGNGAGGLSQTISGLTPSTKYYVRAYATSNIGTVYSDNISFSTIAVNYTGQQGTVNDVEGNTYRTIGIGGQIWMGENLKTTKYRNGDIIGTTPQATLDISNEIEPKYQWAFLGDETNVNNYGRLYTFYTATDNRGVCPIGWHVPSVEEWITLINFAGGYLDAGGKLKGFGTTYWNSPNTGASDYYGFNALPGGYRAPTYFAALKSTAFFLTSTLNSYQGNYRIQLSSSSQSILTGYSVSNSTKYGGSIRCLKD